MIEHLRANVKTASDERLAFFYFDGTDQRASSEMSDANKVMRSLLKQLALQSDGIQKVVFDAWQDMHNSSELTADECIELMVEVSSQLQTTWIVLDGFDECTIEVQRDLAALFQKLMLKAKETIRLFVSARPSVARRLSSWIHADVNVRDNNLGDLTILVREKVTLAAETPEFRALYWRGSESRVDEVITTLETHAHGMFRWVQSALTFLHLSQHYMAMTEALKTLPQLEDLMVLYGSIWDEQVNRLTRTDRKVVKALILFSMYGLEGPWLAYVVDNEEVSIPAVDHAAQAAEFIMGAITQAIEPTVKTLDLIRLCPDFLDYPEIDVDNGSNSDWLEYEKTRKGPRLSHVSVREFLVTAHGDEYLPGPGHAFLADLCLSYWLEQNLGRGFGHYAGANWGDHLLQACPTDSCKPVGHTEEIQRVAYLENSSFVAAFLGGATPSAAFSNWSKWLQSNQDIFDVCVHECKEWTTKPVSTILARIKLGLPIDDLSDDQLQVEPYVGWRGTTLRPRTTLEYAEQVGNQQAVEYLTAKGISRVDPNQAYE